MEMQKGVYTGFDEEGKGEGNSGAIKEDEADSSGKPKGVVIGTLAVSMVVAMNPNSTLLMMSKVILLTNATSNSPFIFYLFMKN